MRLARIVTAVLAVTAATVVASSSPVAAAPATPLRLHTTNVTATQISLAWSQNTSTGPVRARVYKDGVLAATTSLVRYTATGLTPEGTYSFYVVAIDSAGNASAPTRTVTVTTRGPGVVPPGPANLRATDVAPGRIDLAFDQPEDSWDITGYQVFDGTTVVATAYTFQWWGIPTIPLTVHELAPGTAHSYSVRAYRDTFGASAPSNTLALTTPARTDTSAPSTPADFQASMARYACFSVILTWNQSTDNSDPQAAIDYQIFINGGFHAWVRGTGTAQIGIVPFGNNTITVRAVDRSGNASATAAATFFRPDWCTDDQ